MKRFYPLFALCSVLTILGASLLYRFQNSEKVIVPDLLENWEKTFERDRIEIRDNFDFLKDKAGYYDYGTIGELIDDRSEFDELRDTWDGMGLQGILLFDSAHLLFEAWGSSLDGSGWYAYGDNADLLRRYNFEIRQIVKGKDNWFYIKARRPQREAINRKMKMETIKAFNHFDWHKGAEFTQVKSNDAIALQLIRVDSLRFKYRIELNRQWKGSIFDSGTVIFDKVVANTGIFLEERRPDCKLEIFISNDNSKQNLFALVNRVCGDTTKNIDDGHFSRMGFKSGF